MSGKVYMVTTMVTVQYAHGESVVFTNIESDTDLSRATGDAVTELTNYSYYEYQED